MNSLNLTNNGPSPLVVNDLGIEVLVGESFDLLANFTAEDITESIDFESVYSQGANIVLFDGTDTYNMSYQDVIDYLTPLTRWDKIDYSYISNKDIVSDITSDELEELTNGDSTSLHNHDDSYYTKIQLQTPGNASVHWDNVVGSPTGSTRVVNGDLYFQDPTRNNKWLSAAEQQFVWSEHVIDGKYMSVGQVKTSNSGYLMPQNLTLTKVALNSNNNSGKIIQIRKNGSSVFSFTHSGTSYIDTSLNIDFSTGELLQVFVSGSGGPLKSAVFTLYGKWRTT